MSISVEQTITQWSDLIHKESLRVAEKLPPNTAYTHEDLYQEGAVVLSEVVPKFDAARQVRLITYLTVCLRNRYYRLMRLEWRRFNVSQPMEPGEDDGRSKTPEPSTPAEQLGRLVAVEEVTRLLRRQRYRTLAETRWPQRTGAVSH